MDNLRKRDYANFNNGNRGNRRYSSRDSFGDVNSDNRNRYNNKKTRGNNINRAGSEINRNSMNRNIQVQYSNKSNNRPRGNSNSRLANVYENFSNTVQKKFNSVLYKGAKSNDRERIETDSIKLEEESQMNVPKSVFVFITIAVIFATGLVVLLAQPPEDNKSLVANDKNNSKEIDKQDSNDDGFKTYAEWSEEELQEKLDALEDGINSEETDTTKKNENGTTKTEVKSTTPSKLGERNNSDNTPVPGDSNTKTGTSDNKNNSITDTKTTINTNVPRATIKPENNDDEEDDDLIDYSSDEGTFTLPCSIPAQGGLYKSVYSYASVGSDGRFVKYTNYVNEPYGASIPKKDLNGMWLVSKGLTLSEASVSSVSAYRNGIKVDVCKITIYVNGTTKKRCIYAMKDSVVPFTDGNYKIKGTNSYISSLTVTRDVSVVEY